MITFIFSLSLASAAVAAEKPTCDIQGVTRNCDFFREKSDQKEIPLSDGTFVKNPLYQDPAESGNRETVVDTGLGLNEGLKGVDPKAAKEFAYNQAEIVESLEGSGFPMVTKICLSQMAGAMIATPEKTYEIPLPESSAPNKMRRLSGVELQSLLKNKLSDENYRRFTKTANAQGEKVQQKIQARNDRAKKAFEAAEKEKAEKLKNEKHLQIRLNKAKELFKYAKENMVEIIRRGKKDSELTTAEKSMIAKVQTVKLDEEGHNSNYCNEDPDNAAYFSFSHRMIICKGILQMADAQLLYTIGHEIAHSIDPCNGSAPLYRVNKEKFKDLSPKTRKSAESEFSENQLVNSPTEIYYTDSSYIEEMVRVGALVQESPTTKFSDYPMKPEYNCLVQKLKFRENSSKDVQVTSEYLKGYNLGDDPNKKMRQEEVKKFAQAFKKYPQCLKSINHGSEMGEAMSDVFGALLMEKYVTEHPFKTEADRVGALFDVRYCGQEVDDEQEVMASPYFISVYNLGALKKVHPRDVARISKIQLNLPGVAEAYNCRRTHPTCFDHLSMVSRMPKSSAKKSQTQTNGAKR